MADNAPIPSPVGGPVPPKPAEAAKVQPKKETVRISLPPKPTASPTIKIPAPQAPAAAQAAAAPAAAAPAASAAAPAAKAPAAAPAAAPRPAPAPSRPVSSAPAVSGFDKAIAVAAAIVGIAVVASLFYIAK